MGLYSTVTTSLRRCSTIKSSQLIKNAPGRTTTKFSTDSSARQYEEIQIKVPWGHISAKWWGTKSVRPILGIHGWQDNAGTFDTLAPLLPDHVGLLAIDLPGHGLSSRLPNGVFYNRTDYIHTLRLLMKEFKWDKLSILGHSMSASIGFIFSSLFPDKVDMMIGFDMLKPFVKSEKCIVDRLVGSMEGFLVADDRNRENNEPPSYTYEECIERLYIGAEKSIDKDKCSYILNRNLQKSVKFPGKYYFNRDSRLKFLDFGTFYNELCLEMASQITCPYIFIKAKGSKFFEDEKYYYETLDVMKKSNPKFEYLEVDGKHHVHLNEPEKISRLINSFINKYRVPEVIAVE